MSRFYIILLLYLVSLSSCNKEESSSPIHPAYHPKYHPLSTTEYLRDRKGNRHIQAEAGQRTSPQCDFPREEINSFIDTLQLYLAQDYGTYQASYYCDTLRTHQEYTGFFVQAPVTLVTNNFPSTTDKAIDWALAQQPRPRTRVDSAARVVNYVFTQYSYGGGSALNPQNYLNAQMETIGAEITANRLAGLCGDLTHYLGIIINTKFPFWGTPVSFCTEPTGTIGHTFAGLCGDDGTVYMVLDPTVNVIWVNELNEALSLEDIQQFLISEPEKVYEASSVVFGSKQKQFSESQCVLYSDFEPGTAAAIFEPQTQFYSIQANWYGFTDTTSLNYRALIAPYWASRHFPGNTWANQCLIIENVACGNAHLQQTILGRYGDYAGQKGF